jgi:hypothetical protein
MCLVGIFYLILKLTVAFWQFSFDDTYPPAIFRVRYWKKKHCLTNLKLMHDASLKLVHYREYELFYL